MSANGENENHKQRVSGETKQAGSPDVAAGEASTPSPQTPAKPQGRGSGAAAPGAVLPNKAAEDDPRRWGDHPGSYDHDAWLKEQRPPHWG